LLKQTLVQHKHQTLSLSEVSMATTGSGNGHRKPAAKQLWYNLLVAAVEVIASFCTRLLQFLRAQMFLVLKDALKNNGDHELPKSVDVETFKTVIEGNIDRADSVQPEERSWTEVEEEGEVLVRWALRKQTLNKNWQMFSLEARIYGREDFNLLFEGPDKRKMCWYAAQSICQQDERAVQSIARLHRAQT
jgi:hypothetical protein